MTSPSPAPPRKIGWNGITLTLPRGWECIVSAPRHLLFEENFEPMLEIRWDELNSGNVDGYIKGRISQLKKEFGADNLQIERTKWSKLLPQFKAVSCNWSEGTNMHLLLLVNQQAKTSLLCRIFDQAINRQRLVEDILSSMECNEDQDDTLFSILDFSCLVPGAFSLLDYSIKPGLTRLSFSDGSHTLHICRLAAAGERLKANSKQEILSSLAYAQTVTPGEFTDTGEYLETYTEPTILKQVRARLKRQKPFIYGRLWHYQTADRFLGFVVEGITPIPETLISTIYSSYEIIQTTEQPAE